MIRTTDGSPWSDRQRGSTSHRTKVRSSFDIDRERVIHSHSFRQLQHKTQVQSVIETPPNARFRTRLNHVIEVAQLSRGVAHAVGADPSLSEAIALAHDLGHPPFGHAGERALQGSLQDLGCVDWNANTHSLLVVDEIECCFVSFRGLDLTWATREGIARHSTPFDEPIRVGEFSRTPNAGLESQIVDACDVLAYVAHDLDDALADGYVSLKEVATIDDGLGKLVEIAFEEWERQGGKVWPEEERPNLIRQSIVARLISLSIKDLTSSTRENIESSGVSSPLEVRSIDDRLVTHSREHEATVKALLSVLLEKYYRSSTVAAADSRGAEVLMELFQALIDDPSSIPSRFLSVAVPLAAANYLVALNDRSAAFLAQSLGIRVQEIPQADPHSQSVL